VTADVTVITASLPTRGRMLAECVASVAAQTVAPAAHLIGVDYARRGTSAIRNDLWRMAKTEWIAVLDDDDILLPHHLEYLVGAAGNTATIAYSFCAVDGRPGWNPSRPFDAAALREGPNYIPATILIRRPMLYALDGWRDSEDCLHGWEDYDLLLRALDAHAEFACVPTVTWVYRFAAGRNKTEVGELAAC
jgi:glycosyltransferase involved in cell wall biosynthesis